MTPRERLLLTLDNKPVDRVPVTAYIDYLYTAFLKNTKDIDIVDDCYFYQKLLGFDIFLRGIRVPLEKVDDTEEWMEENTDEVLMDGRNVITFANTPQGKLRKVFRTYYKLPGELPSYAIIEPFIKSSRDFEIYAKYYPKMRIKSLDNIKRARRLVGDSGIISSDIASAFNNAVILRGAENLIIDAMEDLEFYKLQMEYQVDHIKRVIDGLAEDPVDLVRHFDNEANGSMMNASFYEKYVLPYVREVVIYAEERGLKVMLHNCGIMGQLLECYPDTGATALESFSPPPSGDADYEKVCRVLQDKMVRVGGIDQIHLLKIDDKRQIAREVEKTISLMKGRSGYIACTSDQIDRDIPLENLFIYRDMALNAGIYG